MSYTKLWVHAIWSTKFRKRIITEELSGKLLIHIKEYAASKYIHIDFLNCVSDHIHMLLSLAPHQNVSDTIRIIKGESSYWVNKQKIIPVKFEWQEEYIALSVSDSAVNKVRDYKKIKKNIIRRKHFLKNTTNC